MADSLTLFACTKCHKRFPFESLIGSSMQCSACQKESSKLLGPTVCTYCREEYTEGDDSASICSKCSSNVKQYGKPRACEICNVIAAFIGSKCKRCVVSEAKWGSPVICEQCKQKCAFNRDDHSKKKVDNKVLCWLCTIAYKRVLSKARRKESSLLGSSEARSQKRRSDHHSSSRSHSHRSDGHHKKSKSTSSTVQNLNGNNSLSHSSDSLGNNFLHDANIVLVTQLREEVESLKKTLAVKEKELLDKERKMTEFKTLKMEADKAHREKIISMQSTYTNTIETLQQKNNEYLKQIATLSRANKRGAAVSASVASSSAPGSNNGSPANKH